MVLVTSPFTAPGPCDTGAGEFDWRFRCPSSSLSRDAASRAPYTAKHAATGWGIASAPTAFEVCCASSGDNGREPSHQFARKNTGRLALTLKNHGTNITQPGFEILCSQSLNWPIRILDCEIKYSKSYFDWSVQKMRTKYF